MQILRPALSGEMFLFSYVNEYIEDAATFTTLAKINCVKYLCNTKVSGLSFSYTVHVHSEVLITPPYDLTKTKISATSHSILQTQLALTAV